MMHCHQHQNEKIYWENKMDNQNILKQYERAKSRRHAWEPLWKECYNYALPQHENRDGFSGIGSRKTDHLYDSTAMDAVEQLAASLLGQLTPPWSSWFGLKPCPDMNAEDADKLSPVLEKASRLIQSHFDRSNFTTEIHQAFLDLITGGTATLQFEESSVGEYSAFRFNAIPLNKTVLEEGVRSGRLDSLYHEAEMNFTKISEKFPGAELPNDMEIDAKNNADKSYRVLEILTPRGLVYAYDAYLLDQESEPTLLKSATMTDAPFISFRWMKTPGEIYGRSPVMKCLPDIKTANKVVELVLKNASIAVAGIWQADDDGVLNPANIDLSPGTIIPKAVGSKGLTPLEMPGRFDISEIVLDDLRSRIRHGLLVDRLGAIGQTRMTATEVIERSSEMALVLGATYGRLQSELLTPLIQRAYGILRRRGEVPDLAIDGRLVAIDYRSPMALAQGQKDVQNILYWINTSLGLGAEAAIDIPAAARHLGEALGVPSDLIRKTDSNLPNLAQALDQNSQSQQKEI
jgi:hypothetical protein